MMNVGNAGNPGAGAGSCHFMFQKLLANSQDGSSLEYVAAVAARECNIQDARGGVLNTNIIRI